MSNRVSGTAYPAQKRKKADGSFYYRQEFAIVNDSRPPVTVERVFNVETDAVPAGPCTAAVTYYAREVKAEGAQYARTQYTASFGDFKPGK